MVEIATSLGRSGLQDWLIQRISAAILGIYTVFLVGYFLFHPVLSYNQWQQLFVSNSMRYSSLLVLLSLLAHAWIGFWTISTDYIKILSLRLALQILFILSVFICFAWGIKILWKL
jgi:succinate dehydrogenase / fumarate reductase membrane anchor subunit